MEKLYGEGPYEILLVHGGPGAMGSLEPLAKGLSEHLSVVEAYQSKLSIHDCIEELHEQITTLCTQPVTLIGHSWGAWLSVLYANVYPKSVKKMILIGCPPLSEEYVPIIEERRKLNMSSREKKDYHEILENLATVNPSNQNELLNQLSSIVKASDAYSPIEDTNYGMEDEAMYQSLWKEASNLRKNSDLLKQFKKIQCDVILIQGDRDPHPYTGIIQPLKDTNILNKTVILDECGHSPWNETNAKRAFYNFLIQELNT